MDPLTLPELRYEVRRIKRHRDTLNLELADLESRLEKAHRADRELAVGWRLALSRMFGAEFDNRIPWGS